MNISVCISTYNRSSSLKRTIESLLKQERLEGIHLEIMIIDHNCTDNTRDMVHGFIANSGMDIKYLFEPKPSLSEARNRAIRDSGGEIIAFTDDDVIVDQLWVCSIARAFRETGCDALSGKILPVYPENTPDWIKDHQEFLNGPFVYRNHGDESRFYDDTMLPFVGAHMVFRRECFKEHGFFTSEFGPGTDFPYGEDVEMFYRLFGRKKIYYCAECIVWHVHSPERVTFKYINRWFYQNGLCYTKRKQTVLENSKRRFADIPVYLYKDLVLRFLQFVVNIFNSKKRLPAWCRVVWMFGYCIGSRSILDTKEQRTIYQTQRDLTI
ncbi:MAG: glycosyltransferase [Candidatus Omnitrophota bacterium]